MKRIIFTAVTLVAFAACKHAPKSTAVVDSVLIKNLRADSLALKGQPPHAPNDRQLNIDTAMAARMAFAVKEYNFGTIPMDRKIHRKYKFTNTGKSPLIISGAIGSCGCTVPSYVHKPIAPGANGSIDVTFNSANTAEGPIAQSVSVTSNGYPGDVTLYLNGRVKASKKSK